MWHKCLLLFLFLLSLLLSIVSKNSITSVSLIASTRHIVGIQWMLAPFPLFFFCLSETAISIKTTITTTKKSQLLVLWNKDFYVPREKKPTLALLDQSKHSSGPWAVAPAWLEFRGRFLGNTQWRQRAKALSSGCFQFHITNTLWSIVMVSVPDRAVLIKGWLMGRKGNLSPMCLFPLDYGCIFSVPEKYLGSCPARGFCGLGLGKNKSWQN